MTSTKLDQLEQYAVDALKSIITKHRTDTARLQHDAASKLLDHVMNERYRHEAALANGTTI